MSDDVEKQPDGKPEERANEKPDAEVNEKVSVMSCEDAQENVDAYLDGELAAELPAGDFAAFEAHLASCEECLARLERRKTLVGLVQTLPRPKAPAGLVERILAATRPERRALSVRLRTWAPALAAAAVLMLAAMIGLRLSRGDLSREAYAPVEMAEVPDAAAAEAGAEVVREAIVRKGADEAGDAERLEEAAFEEGSPEPPPRPAAPPARSARPPGAMMKMKEADRAGAPKVAVAREAGRAVARSAGRTLGKGAVPATEADEAFRFDKAQDSEMKEAPPPAPRPEKRAALAKGGAPARARTKSAAKPYPRGGRRATGALYDERRAAVTAKGERSLDATKQRKAFGERLAEGLTDGMTQVGRAVAIPQAHGIPRQAAIGPERETGRIVLSKVGGVRTGKVRGAGRDMIAKIPIATPDALATQKLIVTLARESGGEFVQGISRPRPARRAFALSARKGRPPSNGRKAAPAEAASNVAALSVRSRASRTNGEKVVVRISGAKAERFLRKIDARFGAVLVEFGTVLAQVKGEPRKVYQAIRRGSVLERLPALGNLAEVTVEFPLMSPAEALAIEAAEADALPAKAGIRARSSREPGEPGEASEEAEPAAEEAPAAFH